MDTKLLVFLVAIAAQLLLSEARTCYSYNYKEACQGPGCTQVVQCDSDEAKCYSFHLRISSSSSQVLLRGCWIPNNSNCSPTADCVFEGPIKRTGNKYLFCCCTGDNCNSSSPVSAVQPEVGSSQDHGAQDGFGN